MNKKRRKNNNTNRIIYIICSILALIILTFLILYFSNKFNTINNDVDIYQDTNNDIIEIYDETLATEPEDISFTLTAIGDIMCHDTQYIDAYNYTTGEYDFNYVFEDIIEYTSAADLTIGNLETTFGGEDEGYRNYPTFNSPDALAYAISNIGVDVLSTASNHSMDSGYDGIERTLEILEDASILSVGTATSQEQRDEILFVDVKGVKIAIISYTYGTNGISVPTNTAYAVNLIDEDLILQDIEYAKSENADMIIACMHWGTEYSLEATTTQLDLTDLLFENGVNIILGNHPHVVEPMEIREVTMEDGTVRECFVIYALGNFISDQVYTNTRNSIILNLEITKTSDGEILIDEVTYTPIYMYKDTSLSIQKMKLLDIEACIEAYENDEKNAVSTTTYNLISDEVDHIYSILGDEIINSKN